MKLSLDQIIEFQTNGVLVVENVFSNEELAPVIAEVEAEVDRRASALKAEGKIKDLYENESFEKRYAFLFNQSPDVGNLFDIKYYRGRAVFEFLRSPNLLDIAECLLGREIECNPIQHLRPKQPYAKGVKPDYMQNLPWHQDAAVTWPEADASEIFTFWIPLIDATVETGCLEVIPGAFKYGLLEHQAEGGTTIVESSMPSLAPKLVPCSKGGIVIMNKYTPHRGTMNTSDRVRWTLDLRYHKTGMHSGRPYLPSFVARSRANPSSELTDYEIWRDMWIKGAKEMEGQKPHRVHLTMEKM